MPLFELSPNVQDMDSAGRKRSHDDFTGDLVNVNENQGAKTPKTTSIRPAGDSLLPPHVQCGVQSSPNGLGSPALTDAGSSTPARNSPCPLTPTKAKPDKSSDEDQTSTMADTMAASATTAAKGPAPKRKRLTAGEKEAKEKEMAEKRKEREEQAARKAAEKAVEKAKQEEEKAARAKEREDKRKQKEEEDRVKAEQKDEKKRKKEEEQRRIQDEKDRKARSQQKLNAYFKVPSTPKKLDSETDSTAASPAKADGTTATSKSVETEYDKLFKPFFVREDTRLALFPTQMDQETKKIKLRILDDFVTKQQETLDQQPRRFDPLELLCLPSKPSKRGTIHHPVKHIMETAYREAESSSGAGDAANHIFEQARVKLANIPQKVIAFSQDVRPPYYGTVTLKPFALGRDIINKLARKSIDRRLPLDYDYDSEAEWQEEEGEDIDMDDDEEELDDEDDLDGFLDDTEDAGLSRRVFGSTMEPESTGICFENYHRLGPCRTVYEHKMEFMHEGLGHSWGINPFSAEYWEQDTRGKMPKFTQPASEISSKMAPPPAPNNAFAALNGEAGTTGAKLVKAELLNDVKQAILDNKALSKVGIIDFIFHQFRDNVSRTEVKNTLEHVAEKKGAGRSKEWDLKAGHELES